MGSKATENIATAPWGMAVVMCLVNAVAFIDRTALPLLVQPITRDLHISDTQMSLLIGPPDPDLFDRRLVRRRAGRPVSAQAHSGCRHQLLGHLDHPVRHDLQLSRDVYRTVRRRPRRGRRRSRLHVYHQGCVRPAISRPRHRDVGDGCRHRRRERFARGRRHSPSSRRDRFGRPAVARHDLRLAGRADGLRPDGVSGRPARLAAAGAETHRGQSTDKNETDFASPPST